MQISTKAEGLLRLINLGLDPANEPETVKGLRQLGLDCTVNDLIKWTEELFRVGFIERVEKD